jgi:hypothetical protein
MSGVLGAVIGDFHKGGQEQMHGCDGAPEGRGHPQNPSPRQPQAVPFSAAPSNAIPLRPLRGLTARGGYLSK